MSQASLRLQDKGFQVSGALTFATVGALWKASQKLFPQQPSWTCDFSQVSACDSAGLALLLEWLHQAKQQQRAIHFIHLPQQLLSIARAANLEELLL